MTVEDPSSIENSDACLFCGKPATHSYVLAKRTVEICSSCLSRQENQDAYERELPGLHQLAAEQRFDEAQHALDRILSAHGDRDLDGWLARSVLAHKALLYLDQGAPERAISTYQQLGQLGFKQPSDRVEYSLGLARALLAKHQAKESIAILEQELDSLDANTAPASIGLLEALALGYATWEKPIPERWRGVLRSAASAVGIDLSESDQEAPLATLIHFAAEVLRSRASGT